MPMEIEAKFKVRSLAVVRKALRAAGAKFVRTRVQIDRFFDTPARTLRRDGCGLRLRSEHAPGRPPKTSPRAALLTFKGPRRKSSRVKVRREVQTRLESDEAAAEILRALGLRETVRISKRRSSYRLGRCLVELDELPRIGCFVEIEAASERAIRKACQKLGLEYLPITASYLELLSQRRRG